jgi:hypothetical protein
MTPELVACGKSVGNQYNWFSMRLPVGDYCQRFNKYSVQDFSVACLMHSYQITEEKEDPYSSGRSASTTRNAWNETHPPGWFEDENCSEQQPGRLNDKLWSVVFWRLPFCHWQNSR